MSRNGCLAMSHLIIAIALFIGTGNRYTAIPNLIAAAIYTVIDAWKTARGGQQ